MSATKSPFFKTCFVHSVCHISKKWNVVVISKYRRKALVSDLSNFYLAKHSLVPILFSLSRNNFIDFHASVLYEEWIKSQVTDLYLHAVCLSYHLLWQEVDFLVLNKNMLSVKSLQQVPLTELLLSCNSNFLSLFKNIFFRGNWEEYNETVILFMSSKKLLQMCKKENSQFIGALMVEALKIHFFVFS